MSKFKIGDNVVAKSDGAKGVITKPVGFQWSNGTDWYVLWNSGCNKGEELWLHEDDFVLEKHTSLQDAMKGCKVAEEDSEEITAAGMLQEAKDCLVARAVERDKPNGERSMESTVEAFNALTGHSLTEEQGWIFMVALKMARSQGGCYKADDYIDMAAYAALAGEAGANNAN